MTDWVLVGSDGSAGGGHEKSDKTCNDKNVQRRRRQPGCPLHTI